MHPSKMAACSHQPWQPTRCPSTCKTMRTMCDVRHSIIIRNVQTTLEHQPVDRRCSRVLPETAAESFAISPFVGITWHVTIVNPRPSCRRGVASTMRYNLCTSCSMPEVTDAIPPSANPSVTDASVTMPLTSPPLSLGSRDAPLWLVLVPVERCLG